ERLSRDVIGIEAPSGLRARPGRACDQHHDNKNVDAESTLHAPSVAPRKRGMKRYEACGNRFRQARRRNAAVQQTRRVNSPQPKGCAKAGAGRACDVHFVAGGRWEVGGGAHTSVLAGWRVRRSDGRWSLRQSARLMVRSVVFPKGNGCPGKSVPPPANME